ncbi:MAG: metallopeptidase family protein [Acidimicrobiales bacterium]
MDPVSAREFERYVADALDALPEEFGRLMENVAVVAYDRHPTEDLLGLYEGIPLTDRDDYGGMVMPDVISLFRLPLCEISADVDELIEEITVTVVHEIAHHFGIDDDALHAWGWG